MDMELVISRFFEFFSVNMLVAALVIAGLVALAGRGRFWEQLFSWTSLLAVGVVGVFTFYCHVFMSERTAENIGWQTSPFQFEVGMADLAGSQSADATRCNALRPSNVANRLQPSTSTSERSEPCVASSSRRLHFSR